MKVTFHVSVQHVMVIRHNVGQLPYRLFLTCLSFPVQSLEDLEDQKRKKKKEKMGLGSLSRVFARGKQRKSMDPGLFDGTSPPDYYIEEDADW